MLKFASSVLIHIFYLGLSALGLTLLSSCETIPLPVVTKKVDCQGLNWFEKGRSQGAKGQASQFLEESKKCRDISLDQKNSYLNGWQTGVNQFCTPEHGFSLGRAGQAYNQICPARQAQGFLEALELGQKVLEIEQENMEYQAELVSLEAQRRSPDQVDNQNRILWLKQQQQLNRSQISKIQERFHRHLTR